MKNSKIAWTDHTFNPWIGCSKVSAGCENCYARKMEARWGRDFEVRRHTTLDYWRQPARWNRDAYESGKPVRVFCGSMCDWLDDTVSELWLASLLMEINNTPHVDWLMLTKRPERFVERMLKVACLTDDYNRYPARIAGSWLKGEAPKNVWFGVTAENQEMWDKRVDILRDIPARVKWVSAEPLIEPVMMMYEDDKVVNWVVAGGENGTGSRKCRKEWIVSLRWQCQCKGVPFFFKQWGSKSDGACDFDGDMSESAVEKVRNWPVTERETV